MNCVLVLLDYAVEEKPTHASVMQQLEDGGPDPLVFVLNANLLSMVKIVNCTSYLIGEYCKTGLAYKYPLLYKWYFMGKDRHFDSHNTSSELKCAVLLLLIS